MNWRAWRGITSDASVQTAMRLAFVIAEERAAAAEQRAGRRGDASVGELIYVLPRGAAFDPYPPAMYEGTGIGALYAGALDGLDLGEWEVA